MARKRRVKCRICGFLSHDLFNHLEDVHNLTLAEYQAKHPDAPWQSAHGVALFITSQNKEADTVPEDNKVAEVKPKAPPVLVEREDPPYKDTHGKMSEDMIEAMLPDRPMTEKPFEEVFGFKLYRREFDPQTGYPKTDEDGASIYTLDDKGKKIPQTFMVPMFKEPGDWTPCREDSYIFDEEHLLAFLAALECKDNMLLSGHTGTGKTSFVKQVAARLNYNVVQVSFDGNLAREDLVGCYVAQAGETVFQESVLPKGLRLPGTIILLDEWDTISSECSFVLQSVLQKDYGMLQLFEQQGKRIPKHRQNVICATSNTLGMGSPDGLYASGTSIQNFSQLNRFGFIFNFKYLSQDKERTLLSKLIVDENGKCVLTSKALKAFPKSVAAIRDGFEKGQISCPVSPRDLINWAEKFILLGNYMRAARYTFLNRLEETDREAVSGIIQRTFGKLTTP